MYCSSIACKLPEVVIGNIWSGTTYVLHMRARFTALRRVCQDCGNGQSGDPYHRGSHNVLLKQLVGGLAVFSQEATQTICWSRMPRYSFEEIVESPADGLYDVRTRVPGPAGALPITEEMLLEPAIRRFVRL